MFKLISNKLMLRIPCKNFNKNVDLNKILVLHLNCHLHNKVLHNAGLFVIVTRIKEYSVLPSIMNNSDIFVTVAFECICFSMIPGEVLEGTISECTPQGINLKIFFKNIFVESPYLPTPSKYEHNGRRWIWIKKIGIDEYYFTINANEKVRFKVLETKYNQFNLINQEKAVEPMTTFATFKQELLGPIVWWD